MTQEKKPWERSPLEIKVIEAWDSEIIGEEGDSYLIEFYDTNMSVVEAKLPKKEFEGWPHPTGPGTCFGIIIYEDNRKLSIGAWPLQHYWNKELIEGNE